MEMDVNNSMINEMAQAGVIFGHKKSKTHPRMKQYVGANRNEIELIDPTAVYSSLSEAVEFLKEVAGKGGIVLLAGTTPPAQAIIEKFAKDFSYPYVTHRWLGGTLTNFSAISSRMKQYEEMRGKRPDELAKYTKKERLEVSKAVNSMSRYFDGLLPLTRLPNAILVVDSEAHETAVREARKLGIPVVAVMDTNDDPDKIDYPIFANDHSRESIQWVFDRIREEMKDLPAKKSISDAGGNRDEEAETHKLIN